MSFFKAFSHFQTSNIDAILERDAFTLDELLDEDDILQEAKGYNRRLVDFLAEPCTISTLMQYMLEEQADVADDDKKKTKYPYIACELLNSDVQQVTDAIFDNEELVDKLFAFVHTPDALHPIRAGYFSRVLTSLLVRKLSNLMQYLRAHAEALDDLVHHVNNYSVMELMWRVLDELNLAQDTDNMTWLVEQKLVPKLLAKLDPACEDDYHINVCDLLATMVDRFVMLGTEPLCSEVARKETIDALVGAVLSTSSSAFLHGMDVLIHLLQRPDDDVVYRVHAVAELVSASLVAYVGDFAARLDTPAATPAITNTAGTLKPFGAKRLKLVELFATLVTTSDAALGAALIEHRVVERVLAHFWEYELNNLLHRHVFAMVLAVLEGTNAPLRAAMLTSTAAHVGLVERIAAVGAEGVRRKEAGERRLGHMGYVTMMSNVLVEVAKVSSDVRELLDASAAWKEYAEGALAAQNEKEAVSAIAPARVAEEEMDPFLSQGIVQMIQQVAAQSNLGKDDAAAVQALMAAAGGSHSSLFEELAGEGDGGGAGGGGGVRLQVVAGEDDEDDVEERGSAAWASFGGGGGGRSGDGGDGGDDGGDGDGSGGASSNPWGSSDPFGSGGGGGDDDGADPFGAGGAFGAQQGGDGADPFGAPDPFLQPGGSFTSASHDDGL